MKIALSSVSVGDQDKELGVEFTQQPAEFEGATFAVFDDTCGNLIQIYSEAKDSS